MHRRRLLAPVLLVLVSATVACRGAGDEPLSAPATLEPPAPSAAAADGTAPAFDGGDRSLGALLRVTGTVTEGRLTGGLEAPVAPSITLTVPSSGGGNGGIFNGVSVDGVETSVVWDGGRPITLAGDGLVDVQPGPFRLGDGALFADMSDAAHGLGAGHYTVTGPVAIGDPGGLARPSRNTRVVARDGASFSGTGSVEGRLPDGTFVLFGPGLVELAGHFDVQSADDVRSATSIRMADGDFELTITVAGGELRAEALLDGDITLR